MSPPTKPAKPTQPPGHPLPKEPPKPTHTKTEPDQDNATLAAVSPAKAMQEQSIAPLSASEKLSVVLRTDSGYEHNLDLPRDVIEKLLDPDVPDGFIEVPGTSYGGQRLHGMRRFLHTAYIKEIDVKGL